MLAAAAVFGQDARFDGLCQVADLTQDECLSALDSLLKGRWLLEDRRRAGVAYAFGHDKVREAVYVDLGDARRRVLHGRAFNFSRDAAPAQLAAHAACGWPR